MTPRRRLIYDGPGFQAWVELHVCVWCGHPDDGRLRFDGEDAWWCIACAVPQLKFAMRRLASKEQP